MPSLLSSMILSVHDNFSEPGRSQAPASFHGGATTQRLPVWILQCPGSGITRSHRLPHASSEAVFHHLARRRICAPTVPPLLGLQACREEARATGPSPASPVLVPSSVAPGVEATVPVVTPGEGTQALWPRLPLLLLQTSLATLLGSEHTPPLEPRL
ncbi:hypothetical protein NDU88_007987 [Pleurodeles waltl]|uniref:Uncharacterized protein n=1 Tax=Pleurodeles waltl TaxID=8319 RepID=A0AAV7NUV8_PLEWA|nr:hypothetical protein NDU88_007987 [Pleurodeles waltl]